PTLSSRPALTPAQALTAMAAQAGQTLDPELLGTLAPLLARLPAARVAGPDGASPERPDPDFPEPDGLNLN
ncbi:hypothetical protein, partial [Deinococcus sp. RIT780]|uniref:hypothetical protein n=1 Tax=Deinococcus sp. RIT780 TaxID=2870472 RepID=UPI001C8AD970